MHTRPTLWRFPGTLCVFVTDTFLFQCLDRASFRWSRVGVDSDDLFFENHLRHSKGWNAERTGQRAEKVTRRKEARRWTSQGSGCRGGPLSPRESVRIKSGAHVFTFSSIRLQGVKKVFTLCVCGLVCFQILRREKMSPLRGCDNRVVTPKG